MKTFKEHILEKLKLSAAETPMMTNKEFFELLREYTKVTNYVAFLPSKICNNIDEMPKFSDDQKKYISIIQPFSGVNAKKITLILRDIYEDDNRGYYEVDINRNGDDIVDFTDEYWLNKIIKYTIKKTKNSHK